MTPGSHSMQDASQRWLLTLSFSAALEETIVGHLLEHREWAPGFTLIRCEGHGSAVALRGSAEQVRGRAARVMVQLVLGYEDSEQLLRHFGETMEAEVFFWRTPIANCGWLSDYARAAGANEQEIDE